MLIKITSTDFNKSNGTILTERTLKHLLSSMTPIYLKYLVYPSLDMNEQVYTSGIKIIYPTDKNGLNITFDQTIHGTSGHFEQINENEGFSAHLYYNRNGHEAWEFAIPVMYTCLTLENKLNSFYDMVYTRSDDTTSRWGREIPYTTLQSLHSSIWGTPLSDFPYDYEEYQALYTYISAINVY